MLEVTQELKGYLRVIEITGSPCSFHSYDTNRLGDRFLDIPIVAIYDLNIGHKLINFNLKFILDPIEDCKICADLFRLQKSGQLFKNKYILTTGEYSLICNVSEYNDLYKSHRHRHELQCYWDIEYPTTINDSIKKEAYNRFNLMEIE